MLSVITLQWALIRLSLLPIIVATLIGVVRFRRLTPGLRYLAILVGVVLVLEVISRLLALRHQPNLFLMPFYTAAEFGLLILVYERALAAPLFTRWAPWLMGAFIGYVVLDSWLLAELTRFRPSQQVVGSLLVLALVGLYYRKLLNELRVRHLEREPMFWVSTGLFVYYLGYIQIGLFSNYLLSYSSQLNSNIWAAHALLSMLLYSCYSLALWLHPQK